jgi:tetratricopeptide (TPR) repeat protein
VISGDLILNGELDGHSLAWERPSTLAFPPEAIACLQEGVEQLQAGDAEAALATFSRSIELAPDFGEAHVFVGLANALSSRIYPAIDHLELATRLQPDNFASHYTLAQLNFKLRIPQKGYEAAENALRCIRTLEQRKMLTQLLKEERTRERNGIARPWFNKPYSKPGLLVAGGGLAAVIAALLLHLHW